MLRQGSKLLVSWRSFWPFAPTPTDVDDTRLMFDFVGDFPDLSINIHPTPGDMDDDAFKLPTKTIITHKPYILFPWGKDTIYKLKTPKGGFSLQTLTRLVQKALTLDYKRMEVDLDDGNNVGAIGSIAYDTTTHTVSVNIASFD